MSDQFKSITLSPLTGVFDARSSADQQLPGTFAWVQNFEISTDGKLQQAHGFARPYAINTIIQTNGVPCPYKNWDWHDQGEGVAIADRLPPTLLFYSTALDGTRQLYLGTKKGVYVLNETSGEWTALTGGPGGGFGVDGSESKVSTRFHAAQLKNNLFFANGIDPLYYTDVTGTTLQEVTSLQVAGADGHPITKPLVIVQWSNVLLIMNLVENGVHVPNRIWWSDLNDGTQFGALATNPNTGAVSISDYQDLDDGERILGAIPLLGYLYVFTDRAIWRCLFTADTISATPTAVLQCSRIYSEPKNRDRCLLYPNTLVSDGDSLYWASGDAIYKYNPYMAKPERTEWIFRASSIIFDEGINGATIDRTSCNSPVAEYWPDQKEIHFSWPVPDAELVGTPTCDILPTIISTGLNRFTLVLNTQFETCQYRDYGMTAHVNFTSNVAAAGQCSENKMFLGASAVDFCLKRHGVGFAREFYSPSTDKYSSVGYVPLLRGEFPFGNFDAEKIIKEFLVDGQSMRNVGNVFRLRTGGSFTVQKINSNDGNCGILWTQWTDKPVKCLMEKSPEAYVKSNIRPAIDHAWQFRARSKYLFYELQILQANGSPPVDGGVILTQFRVKAITA